MESHKSLRDEYSTVVFSISNDLIFWKTFLPTAIEAYRRVYPEQTRLFESGLFAYNIELGDDGGWLHSLEKSAEMNDENLDQSRERFFQWIELASIVRIYNALELLLYQIAETRYLPPTSRRSSLKHLKTAILSELKTANVKHETKNNQFLIAFLQHKSSELSQLLARSVTNLTTSYATFFEFLSQIRHIIVHDAMLLSKDNRNALKSRFGEFLDLYFLIEPTGAIDHKIVFNESKSGLLNLLSICNDLAFNVIKFAFDLEAINS